MSKVRAKSRLSAAAALLVAGAMMLTACGSSDDGGGSDDGAIVIGMLAPLTGAAAVTGEQMADVVKMAVEEINADGGVEGRDLELKVYDDKLTADDAAKAAQRAITVDKVTALVGTLASASALAVREVAERNKVPFLVPAASATEVTEGSEYVYRVTVDIEQLATATIGIAQPLKAQSVALLYDNGAVGQGYAEIASDQAGGLGIDVKAIQYTTGASSMASVVQEAKRDNPDAVMIAGSAGADYGLILKSMVEEGLDVPVMGLTTMIGPDAVSVGGDAYNTLPGLYVALARDPENPRYQEFTEQYAEKHDGEAGVNDFAAQSYDAVHILQQSLEATSGKGGEALADALNDLEPYPGVSVPEDATISFADGHDGFAAVTMNVFQYTDGALKPSTLVLE
ncbi:ABC transporter substrate-binding protein [Nocardioides endophyticus]|uniref:ABC transporter substrate-binding protein n=1 Tax=Nocardioides endophyticus TaxID=1353775 RepID=A0ABP8YXB0_9ACTN